MPIMVAWVLHTVVGSGRQMYDTRLYTRGLQRHRDRHGAAPAPGGIEPTAVAARSTMSREFVTFFEKDMPVVINAVVGIVGSAAILFWYDLVVGAVVTLLFVPVAVLNRGYMRRSLALNKGLNNQLEHEVRVIDAVRAAGRRRPFRSGALLAHQALGRGRLQLDSDRG